MILLYIIRTRERRRETAKRIARAYSAVQAGEIILEHVVRGERERIYVACGRVVGVGD